MIWRIKKMNYINEQQTATIRALKMEIERRDEYIKRLQNTIRELNKTIDKLRK